MAQDRQPPRHDAEIDRVQEHAVIRVLDEQVADRIAAGEVIERPFSIVRELIDNALDAGADEVVVELHSGGLGQIAVRDNGHGIARADMDRVALRHATSKISDEQDLHRVTSLGFRGEALASIAACARLEVVSRTRTAAGAARLIADSRQRRITGTAAAPGTRIQVTRLFADLPARRRFLRRPGTETTLCRRALMEKALAHPQVTFRLSVDGSSDTVLASTDLPQRVAEVLGSGIAPGDLLHAHRRFADFQVTLVGARPELARRDRSRLMVFVNRRHIREYGLAQAVEYGYGAVLPGGRHPVACLFVEIAAHLVDFNVHPAKREARFGNLAPLHQAVVRVVQEAASRSGLRSPVAAPPPVPPQSLPFAGRTGHPPPGNADTRPPAAVADPATPYVSATGTRRADRPVPVAVHDPGPYPASPPPSSATAQPARVPGGVIAPGPSAPGAVAVPDLRGGFRYVGQSLGMFLLVEIEQTLYFIDQHAAHERVLYEQLRRRSFPVQQLLIPIELEPVPAAAGPLLAARGLLGRMGIVVEWEAEQPRRITALAEPLHRLPAAWLAAYLAGMRGSEQDMERAVLADMACKLAVKDGEVLDHHAAVSVVRDSFAIDLQHCPHGRPLWYSVTRRQITAQVGR